MLKKCYIISVAQMYVYDDMLNDKRSGVKQCPGTVFEFYLVQLRLYWILDIMNNPEFQHICIPASWFALKNLISKK